jgi:RHS repeat-associated protein
MGTDKRFTGQRLDDTGLYYYGARYYDPTIGRFISPDSIIQNPANPQTFNRYTYALNNPLRYIDPSGNIVEINGANVDVFYDWAAYGMGWMPTPNIVALLSSNLFQAYDVVRGFDPVMTQALENNQEKVVTVQFGVTGDAGGKTLPNSYPGAAWDVLWGNGTDIDWDITIGAGMAGLSGTKLAPILGHELYHANDPRLSDSIQEEVRAYEYGDRIAYTLDRRGTYDWFPPGSRTLQKAQQALTVEKMPQFYSSLPRFSADNRWSDLSKGLLELLDYFNPYTPPELTVIVGN